MKIRKALLMLKINLKPVSEAPKQIEPRSQTKQDGQKQPARQAQYVTFDWKLC
jgi:hypothetical protein